MAMRSERSKIRDVRVGQGPLDVHEIVGGLGVSRFHVEKDGMAVKTPLSEEDRALVRAIAEAWTSDPDWEQTLDSLEQIRRASKPSLPIQDV